MRWFRVVPLAALCLFVSAADVEGSGDDENEQFLTADNDAPLGHDALLDTILKRAVTFPPERFNSTLQLELVRAEEELSRGRLGLTLWLHQVWSDPSYAFPEKTTIKQLKLPLEALQPKMSSPQTVVKNALYFKEHSTPTLNGFVTLYANGTFWSHRKITVDLPCVKNFGHRSEEAADDSFPVCARGELSKSDFRYGETTCEMRYGSYIRDETLLMLLWDYNAVLTQTVPCTGGGKMINACRVRETQTLRRQTMFAGDMYDELVACFIIDVFHSRF
uniref:Uncharacterized protein n=1 Tax=Plectus sambesii TaxID=2011161 RepID=A0A914X913_9BILA